MFDVHHPCYFPECVKVCVGRWVGDGSRSGHHAGGDQETSEHSTGRPKKGLM